MTIRAATERAAARLAAAGMPPDDARRDAALLARHLLEWSVADWIGRNHAEAPAGFDERLTALTLRRARHEPVAYLTGRREFYGRDFLVDRRVLIPRPETEGLIEAIVGPRDSAGAARSGRPGSPAGPRAVLVDVGTGSGCVAITLALELATAGVRVIGTDVSGEALEVARANAARLGAARVEFVHAPLLPAGLEPVDLVVSNPPYVPEPDRAALPADVRDFEPATALFAGPDGLAVIRDLVPAARGALRPGGRLLFEIGLGQADAVAALVRHAGLDLIEIRPDLQGIPRIVVAERPAAG